MVQRPGGAEFAPGAYVFPGGTVHEDDRMFPDEIRAAAVRELPAFQVAFLQWFRGKDVLVTLERLTAIASRLSAISGSRVGSGTAASSAWRTIGASVPSTSSRTAECAGSARSGCCIRRCAQQRRPDSVLRRPGHVRAVGHAGAATPPLRRAVLPRADAGRSEGQAAARRGDGLALDLAFTSAVEPGDHPGVRDAHGPRVGGGRAGRVHAVRACSRPERDSDRRTAHRPDRERLGDRARVVPV